MLFLSIEDSLFRECYLWRRHRCGSNRAMECPTLMNIPEVRIFMGLSRYYQWFVEGFSNIENLIMELQKKNKNFVLTDKYAEAFRRLKEFFTIMPILKFPNIDKEFLVCTDASKEGLGRFLMRNGQVITYISKMLIRHEQNYVVHDLELLDIVYALIFWRHYLIGWRFELKMDHCGLHHIFT